MALSLFVIAGIVLALWAASKLLRAALQVVQGVVIGAAAVCLLQRGGALSDLRMGWDWPSLVALGQRVYDVARALLADLMEMVSWAR